MLISINPDNPQENKIREIVNCLRKGGIIAYPTDSIYALGCDLYNQKAIERLCRIKQVKPDKTKFSFVCYDLSDLSQYAKQLDNSIFKSMKRTLPGPFTYILRASGKVPKIIQAKKKTVGIRVPDNNIPRNIVKEIGNPILSTSLKRTEDDVREYYTDPELIQEDFGNVIDMVIDGGYGKNLGSTIIDCTNNDLEIIREGLGDLSLI
jgi:tRNA threonylcarbamoyl adenosine modification protein (Sua5/YciO/YrdC/YwlC family)